MRVGLNRGLQVRTAARLRASAPRDERTGLPSIVGLSEADQRELCEVGGGRLVAVAIRVRWSLAEDRGPAGDGPDVQTLALREAARLIDTRVRRTDVFGVISNDMFLVLAPGLDVLDGRGLATRLRTLLDGQRFELDGRAAELAVEVGATYRAADSTGRWSTPALAAEAERQAA